MYLDNENRPAITPQLALRVAILGGIALVMFGIIFFRLWYLQVLSGDKYLAQARDNQIRDVLIQAPRGKIVDRNGNVLVKNRIAYAVSISPDKLPKVQTVKTELRQRMHRPLREQGAWLRSVVGGHVRYYGVPTNGPALYTFRFQVGRLWFRTLQQRSQRQHLSWARMRRHIDRWLPPARVCHPYPLRRAWRQSLRQEPDAGNPHVRICGGGGQ